MTSEEIAKFIDHTQLAPEATPLDIANLCVEARMLNVAAVCFSPSFLPLSALLLADLISSNINVACVIGFPSGAHAGAVSV